MVPKIRNIIIFIVIAIAFILIYIFFIKSSPNQGSLISSSPTTALPNIDNSEVNTDISNKNSLVTQDFLALLLNVKNIKLDDSIFSDPAFNSLHDSSITLVPDATTGRPNPFAQFGAELPAAGVTTPVAGPSGSTPSNVGTGKLNL